jgi:protein-disulfide isomerase
MAPNPWPQNQKNNLLIPLSIVIAGALIAGAVFVALTMNKTAGPQVAGRPVNQHPEKNMRPIDATDHIRGSATAPIMLVEYSDTDCYYCNRFHSVMEAVMATYGGTGKVAWVYRHFNTGIASHPHTEIEAIASECVAELGGNDKFWQFIDLMFKKKDFESNPPKLIEPSTLPTHAASIGINKTQFTQCLESGKYQSRVADMTLDAQKAGGRGTPYNIVVSKAVISKELQDFIADTNLQILGPGSLAPDAIYVSEDKKMIVLNGAMPFELTNVIMELLVRDNS